ncbi:putative MFS family arabinose efflux permease [Stackebrandtia albiflava]|uniref:Putative MFS family arabinose efflux permease n=1 Tax=Stackebrandtia albiflava TaxID=406432 RepID=A0A562V3Z1_9ACTN|nr:MFS transporter [Stackebrandtia albiflava]TWJ12604.1 putative MFS family arabinose efflux permease [Stackebrandtia albiflava]
MTTTSARTGSRLATLGGNRDFRSLWLGQAASDFGGSLTTLAVPLLAVALTGSEVVAGLLGSVGFVAMWLAQLPGGYLADMCDRRAVMLWCDGIRAVLFGAVTVCLLLGAASVWMLFVLTVVSGALMVVFNASHSQAVRQIVPRDQIPEAVSLTQARGFAVSVIGPSVGGVLYAAGRVVPFAVDSLSYLFSMWFVGRLRTPLRPSRRPSVRRLLPDVGEGWRELWRNRFLRARTVYSTVTNVAVSALMYTLIIGKADESVVLGVAMSAAAGAGLIGSLISPYLQRRIGLRALLVATALVRGGCLAAAAVSGSELLFAATLAVVMLLGPVVRAALAAATLLLVPGDVLGRASSSSAFVGSALQPLAPLLAGFLLAAYAPTVVQWILAVGFGVVALCALMLPGLDVRPATSGED